MSKVVRFFHIRDMLNHTGRGGATIRVSGDTEAVGQVDVQYVECSRKDMYCKKTGRSLAEAAPVKVVNLRDLPRELNSISQRTEKHRRVRSAFPHNFEYAIRYFLPKE